VEWLGGEVRRYKEIEREEAQSQRYRILLACAQSSDISGPGISADGCSVAYTLKVQLKRPGMFKTDVKLVAIIPVMP